MSRIVIDENRCKGCSLCTTVCPFDLIHIADRFNAKGYRPAEFVGTKASRADSKPSDSRSNGRHCTGCANCAAMCPDVAITVYRARTETRTRTETHNAKLETQQIHRLANLQHHRRNGRGQQHVPSRSECAPLSSDVPLD
jgi:2-oxoglutarate ferredoxin oxidoreductase subunit delta